MSSCSPTAPGSSPPVLLVTGVCTSRAVGAVSRDALGVLGASPLSPPSVGPWVGRLPPPAVCGSRRRRARSPSPAPSQAPGACQVVRLPVTLLGSSSLERQLSGSRGGERPPSSGSAAPRLSTLGPAVPEACLGLALRQRLSGASWGVVGSRSRSGPGLRQTACFRWLVRFPK